MWQLQEAFLPKVHLSLEKELSVLMPWYFESSSKQPCSLGIPLNHQSCMSYMWRIGPFFSDWRAWRMVQKDQMCQQILQSHPWIQISKRVQDHRRKDHISLWQHLLPDVLTLTGYANLGQYSSPRLCWWVFHTANWWEIGAIRAREEGKLTKILIDHAERRGKEK